MQVAGDDFPDVRTHTYTYIRVGIIFNYTIAERLKNRLNLGLVESVNNPVLCWHGYDLVIHVKEIVMIY